MLKHSFGLLWLLLLSAIIIADDKCSVNNKMEVTHMRNQDIRRAAEQSSIRLWRIADALGITDSSFSRKLRKELPPEEKKKIFLIIGELSKEVS